MLRRERRCFGERGWLAIDPKRLLGERSFDFANIFTNPDLTDLAQPVARSPVDSRTVSMW